MANQLFPAGLPERTWTEFSAAGFTAPVCGVVHSGLRPPVCGVPLGGIDTGCLDLEATGLLGYCAIFNSLFPRRGQLNMPFLGLCLGEPTRQTWVLTTLNISGRQGVSWADLYGRRYYAGLRTCRDIRYWGHYPVADMEFETDCPVSVGLRAWAPFIPGDLAASNSPGAVFEVHLRNTDRVLHEGCVAFTFPGPTVEEAGTARLERRQLSGSLRGVEVAGEQTSYALGAISTNGVRAGGELGIDGGAWEAVRDRLPLGVDQAGASLAAHFRLEAGEEAVVRFVLAWHAPQWRGGGRMNAGGNLYRHMYASRFASAAQAAQWLADHHTELLSRVLAWQQVIYGERRLPAWLRDGLVNVLHLITETSVWAQARPPVGPWCRPEDGVFGMNESPRWCPQIECIPCSFYGNLPVVYFFPELALSTLRAYKAYQYPSGAAPWVFGGLTVGSGPYEVALPSPGYARKPQTTLDGPCYAELVDKLWRRTGDDAVLSEFYESVKRNVIFTMDLRPGSGAAGIVSMPAGNEGYDWYEACDLFGIVPHIGGAHLAQLRIAHRMAQATGDAQFARQCREWIEAGGAVLEEHGWAGTHYVLFNELETGRRSDVMLAYQLDGEWIARFHGLAGVVRPDRVLTTLDAIRRTSVAATTCGAVTFCQPDGRPLDPGQWSPGYWGTRGVHPPGTFMLAMTYMYAGEVEFGLDLARRAVAEVIRRGCYWDWPVVLDGTPHPEMGRDYYQNMMLWALPAAAAGQDLAGPCATGGLVDRVIATGIGRMTGR